MTDSVTAALLDALIELGKQEKSREVSLAMTKVDEALLWWRKSQRDAQEQRYQDALNDTGEFAPKAQP